MKTYTKSIGIRLSHEEYIYITKLSEKTKLTKSNVLRKIIQHSIRNHNNQQLKEIMKNEESLIHKFVHKLIQEIQSDS